MGSLFSFICIALLVLVGLYFLFNLYLLRNWSNRQQQRALFKPLTRLAQTDSPTGGRRRAGPLCFVTGIPRTICECDLCQNERRKS